MAAVPALTELGRRVLGHLPVWVEDEAARIEAQGGPEHAVCSYTPSELTDRLAEDPSIVPALAEDEVATALSGLASQGLASQSAEDWRMTELGLEALTNPAERPHEKPGAVTLELHPAQESSISP